MTQSGGYGTTEESVPPDTGTPASRYAFTGVVQPARFALTFTNRDGRPETPYCIHRAPLGAHERYIGFLIEHYGGNFPVWLAPQQVAVVPITSAHDEYAQSLANQLVDAGVRAEAEVKPALILGAEAGPA